MEFVNIENDLVRLKEITVNDFDALYRVASDKGIWEQHPNFDRYQLDGFRKYFDRLLKTNIAYLIIDKQSNQVIGATSFYEFDEEKSRVAIGFSFLARDFWGNGYNASIKKLMLDYAFQFVEEVIFHVQEDNLRSQAALQKIGAVKRGESPMPDPSSSLRYEFVIYKDADKRKETFETWNNIASIYEDKFMGLAMYNETYDHVCDSISKPQAKLLEIGCGPGNITKYLLSKRPDFDVLGIDIAPNMVDLAIKNNPTAHFVVMDTRNIKQLEDTYDGIIAGFCLPYLSSIESREFIQHAYQLLNQDGLLYLSFVAGDPALSGYKVGSAGRVYFYYHEVNDLKDNLSRCLFYDIEMVEVKYPTSETEYDIHTILTAKKQSH